MKPIVHGLEREYAGRVRFLYLDVADPRTAAARRQLGYEATPHFFLLRADGTVAQQWSGPVDRADLERRLAALLGG